MRARGWTIVGGRRRGLIGLMLVSIPSAVFVSSLVGAAETHGPKPLVPQREAIRLGTPPRKIPGASLVQQVGAESADVIQEGTRYNFAWVVRGRFRENLGGSPRWPGEVVMDPVAPILLDLGTTRVPDDVLVRVFSANRLRRGIPTAEPVTEIECTWQYDHPAPCLLRSKDGTVAVKLPSWVGSGGFRITAFATWVLPPQSAHRFGKSHFRATWLFSVRKP